jgi:hypothetical protein
VAALHAHHVDDEVAEFLTDLELFLVELAEVGRQLDLLEQRIGGHGAVHR